MLKMRISELRRIVKSIMIEGAVSVEDYGNMKTILLYNPQAAIDAIEQIVSQLEPEDDIDTDKISNAIDDSARGMIRIKEPKDPAYGAWEVISSAGKGYGKLLYGIAYTLSPNKCIMPDRNKVSPNAKDAWKKVFNKNDRIRRKLDDKYNPKTPPKFDDAKVHGGEDEYLDYAYSENDNDAREAYAMNKRHEQTMNTIYNMLKPWYDKPKHIQRMFAGAANALFNATYAESQ